jgi:hypothetical protein
LFASGISDLEPKKYVLFGKFSFEGGCTVGKKSAKFQLEVQKNSMSGEVR